MRCPNCNSEIPDNSNVCPICGNHVANVNYNNNYNPAPAPVMNNPMPHPADVPSTLANLIAFFFPEFGIILYFAWQNLLPAKSKSIGKVTLAAIIIRVVLALLGIVSVLVITFAFGFPILEEIWEEIYWYF